MDKRIYKNLKIFCEGKNPSDHLFDRVQVSSPFNCKRISRPIEFLKFVICLQITSLNAYMSKLMEGLTAYIFSTYNFSMMFQKQLMKFTDPVAITSIKVRATLDRIIL